jgi:SAM-dependent methyltransferase
MRLEYELNASWQVDYTNMADFSNFLEIQTRTPWERTLVEFASWSDPGPGSLVLDIGCHALGIDLDFTLLASRLFPLLAQASACRLPFCRDTFELITATNVLFLLNRPLIALEEWQRVLKPEGQLCLLNPSENLSLAAAGKVADERGLDGRARESLLNWARNAEDHFRWTEQETRDLLAATGLGLSASTLRVGPGFARFVRALKP